MICASEGSVRLMYLIVGWKNRRIFGNDALWLLVLEKLLNRVTKQQLAILDGLYGLTGTKVEPEALAKKLGLTVERLIAKKKVVIFTLSYIAKEHYLCQRIAPTVEKTGGRLDAILGQPEITSFAVFERPIPKNLTARIKDSLRLANITNIGELMSFGAAACRKLPRVGEKNFRELTDFLRKLGLELPP